MAEWLTALLTAIGVKTIWGGVKRAWLWVRPRGLVSNKPLVFAVGETAYVASHPYTPDRAVKDVVIQVKLGNPHESRARTIMTFRLDVKGKAPYHVSEARESDKGGWFLVPPGGGFSTVPHKPYMQLPRTIPPNDAVVGWVGFCLLERNDLTLAEAWRIDANVVAIEVDGREATQSLPVCRLPEASLTKE